MMLKRIFPIVISILLILCFAGCDQETETQDSGKSQKITIQDPTSSSLDDYKKQDEETSPAQTTAQTANETKPAESTPEETKTAETKPAETKTEETKTEVEKTGETATGGTKSGVSVVTQVEVGGTTYCANTNTMKFHYTSCRAVKKMNPENMYNTNSRTELIGSGYVPCAICNP